MIEHTAETTRCTDATLDQARGNTQRSNALLPMTTQRQIISSKQPEREIYNRTRSNVPDQTHPGVRSSLAQLQRAKLACVSVDRT